MQINRALCLEEYLEIRRKGWPSVKDDQAFPGLLRVNLRLLFWSSFLFLERWIWRWRGENDDQALEYILTRVHRGSLPLVGGLYQFTGFCVKLLSP